MPVEKNQWWKRCPGHVPFLVSGILCANPLNGSCFPSDPKKKHDVCRLSPCKIRCREDIPYFQVPGLPLVYCFLSLSQWSSFQKCGNPPAGPGRHGDNVLTLHPESGLRIHLRVAPTSAPVERFLRYPGRAKSARQAVNAGPPDREMQPGTECPVHNYAIRLQKIMLQRTGMEPDFHVHVKFGGFMPCRQETHGSPCSKKCTFLSSVT
jgi:hypothetical protein